MNGSSSFTDSVVPPFSFSFSFCLCRWSHCKLCAPSTRTWWYVNVHLVFSFFEDALFSSLHIGFLSFVQHDAQLDFYGERLATCSSDHTVKIFNVKGGKSELVQELKGCGRNPPPKKKRRRRRRRRRKGRLGRGQTASRTHTQTRACGLCLFVLCVRFKLSAN